jgi:hypothetical protein
VSKSMVFTRVSACVEKGKFLVVSFHAMMLNKKRVSGETVCMKETAEKNVFSGE